MIAPLFAADVPEYLLIPIKIFAMIGAGAAGGFGSSWIARAVAKLSFNQSVPGWLAWFIRSMGFVACGLLAYLWLFGTGTGGVGGGGFGLGGKEGGPKEKVVKKDESARKEKDGKPDKDSAKVPPDQTLRVEVLGDAALKRLGGVEALDAGRRYRIQGKPELLSLKEVQALVTTRRAEKPGLRKLEVVLYGDSPDRKRPQVALLESWAKDLSEEKAPLAVAVSEEEGDAP